MSKTIDTDTREYIVSEEIPLSDVLRRLEKLTELLRRFGLLIFGLTIVGLALSVASSFRLVPSLATLMLIDYTALGCGLMSLTAVIMYESYRKRGDALFEEVSDELQWHIRFFDEGSKSSGEKRPELHARVILRSFARTTDLPLVPGRFGPAVYFAVNIISLSLVAWTIRFILYY